MNREIEVNNEEEDKENELIIFFFFERIPLLRQKKILFLSK